MFAIYRSKSSRTSWILRFEPQPDALEIALRNLGRMAADPAIPFSWYDAACASQKIRSLSDTVNFAASMGPHVIPHGQEQSQ